MNNNIATAVFREGECYSRTSGVWQYDYGQILQIEGITLPATFEVHFSDQDREGESLIQIGAVKGKTAQVQIPDSFLRKVAGDNYSIYAFIYLTDTESGETKYKITIPVRARPKPNTDLVDTPEEKKFFREAIEEVNNATDRAEKASQEAKDSVEEVSEKSEQAKKDILSKLEQEASKYMDNVIKNATEIKTELIAANANAIQTKNDLDETNAIASKLNSSLKDKVEDGIQSDWNQNDDTAVNYIKNRPFYTYYVEDTVNYNPNSGSIALEGFIPFKEGDNVTVKIDNTEYSKNVSCIQNEHGPTLLYIGDNPINEESFNWCIISEPSEDETYIFVAKEPHSITYKKRQFHTIDSRYIPVSANAFRSEYDVFASSITTSPEIETTRANQYPNKKTLTDLSVETFNKMLDGSITIPDYITVNRDIASVSVYQDKIEVRWSGVDFYYQNKVGLAGIWHSYFDAIICEDDANPGTIISKYARVTIYDKKIS